MSSETVTSDALAEMLYRILDSGFAASEVERAYELLLRHESQREKRNAMPDELQRAKDELAKVIKAYDSAMVRLSEETRRRIALNREDRIPGPIKPARDESRDVCVFDNGETLGCVYWEDYAEHADDWSVEVERYVPFEHACDKFDEKKAMKRKRQVNVTSLGPGDVLCVKRGDTVFDVWENKGKENEDVHVDVRLIDQSACPIDHSAITGWCARCGKRVI